MTDLVYIYADEYATWNELRFSLRSVEKNLSGFNKIWIVGNPPPWIENCEIVRCPTVRDEEVHRKYFDVNLKFHFTACNEEMADKILLLWDDIIIHEPTTVEELTGPWHVGEIDVKANLEIPGFQERLATTLSFFPEGALNFESHMPKRFSRSLLKEIFNIYDPILRRLVIPSLYYNHYRSLFIPKTCEDLITRFYGKDSPVSSSSDDRMWIKQQLKGKKILNYNNHGLTPQLMEYIMKKFPLKSKFEFDDPILTTQKEQSWRSSCC